MRPRAAAIAVILLVIALGYLAYSLQYIGQMVDTAAQCAMLLAMVFVIIGAIAYIWRKLGGS